MEEKYLLEICNPKQWKTIPKSQLLENGKFPVYGANGIIGRYNEYNHEKPTVLITCRGATCGNIHITVPNAYINGNAMALDNLNEIICKKEYLYYFLQYYDMSKIISGTAQPQITITGLKKVKVKLYSINKQEKIVNELNKINKLIKLKKRQLEELQKFIKSQFVEMFGDIHLNDKKWKEDILKNNISIIGGYAFKSSGFQKNGIPILRIGNINTGKFRDKDLKFWKEDKLLEKYVIYPKDVLISLTGTVGKEDYGNVCIIGNEYPKYYLNQRNAKLHIGSMLSKEYFSYALKEAGIKKRLLRVNRGVRQANISNKDIEELKLPVPPITLQNKFSEIVKQIDKQKFEIEKSLKEAQELYESLMEKYFG